MQEFDDISIKEKVKNMASMRYNVRNTKEKNRERSCGTGRPFKFDIDQLFNAACILPFVNYIYKKNHHPNPKQVVNVFDLGHLGVEKHYEKQISLLPHKKKKDLESPAGEKECKKSH